jgi:hypothetical protein
MSVHLKVIPLTVAQPLANVCQHHKEEVILAQPLPWRGVFYHPLTGTLPKACLLLKPGHIITNKHFPSSYWVFLGGWVLEFELWAWHLGCRCSIT